MSWLIFLRDFGYVVHIVTALTALFYVMDGWKRTRNRAFLLLTFSYILSLFLVVFDATIATQHMPHNQLLAYRTVRSFALLADVILLAIGLIFLTRSFLSISSPGGETKPDA